jgi:hypothetical protein
LFFACAKLGGQLGGQLGKGVQNADDFRLDFKDILSLSAHRDQEQLMNMNLMKLQLLPLEMVVLGRFFIM